MIRQEGMSSPLCQLVVVDNVDVQLMWNALLDVARGKALTSNAVPSKKVRCDGSFNVSGLAVKLCCPTDCGFTVNAR